MAQAQYTNITTVGTTLCAVGPGTLEAVVVNKAVVNGVITIYDSVGALTNKIGTITFGAALKEDPPISTTYGVRFANGCLVVSSTAVDMTVVTQGVSGLAPPVTQGMTGWFDFGDPTTLFTDTGRTAGVVADADVIKGVRDKSNTGAHLSEATIPPSYKVNIFNGRPIARFDRTATTRLSNTSANALTQQMTGNDTPFSFYTVFAANSGAHGNDKYLGWGWSNDNHLVAAGSPTGQAIQVMKDDALSMVTANGAGSLTIGRQYVCSYISPGTTVSAWRDNNLLINAAAFDKPAITTNQFGVGGYILSGGFFDFASVDIGEIIAYTGVHSEQQRRAIQTYLAAKWGVSLA